MQVQESRCAHGFAVHKVYKSTSLVMINDSPRLLGGMYIDRAQDVSVSPCGKFWCFYTVDTITTHKVVIVEGLCTERAYYTPESKRVAMLCFTPRTTIFVKPRTEQSIVEIDVDGRELRRIDICRDFFSVTCTPTRVVLTAYDSFDVYDYATGAPVSTFVVPDTFCLHSLLYSPFTQKLYVQEKRQLSARGLTLQADGTLVPDAASIRLHAGPIGLQHWFITDTEDVVVLRDYEGVGICFRDTRLQCQRYDIMRLTVIPGGFFIHDRGAVYFLLDRFSYTRKELFVRACV